MVEKVHVPGSSGECRMEEEIDLADLAAIIYKRRKIMVVSILLIMLCIVVGGLIMPQKYRISTIIETGLVLDSKGQYVPIENSDAIKSKIKAISKKIISENVQQDAKKTFGAEDINIDVTKNGNIVEITMDVPPSSVDEVIKFFDLLDGEIIKSHGRIFEQVKKDLEQKVKSKEAQIQNKDTEIEKLYSKIEEIKMDYEASINEKNNKIEYLNNRIKDLKREKEIEKEKIALLNEEKQDLMKRIEWAEKEYQTLLKAKLDVNNTVKVADAIGVLLYSNDILQLRNYLSQLRDRLLLQIPKEIKALELSIEKLDTSLEDARASKELEEIKLRQMKPRMEEEISRIEGLINTKKAEKEAIESEIKALKNKIDNMLVTKVLLEPHKSENPVSPNIKLMAAVGFVLSVFFSVFLVFVVEFWLRNKEKIRGSSI